MTMDDSRLSPMAIAEATEIGRLCANEEAGYPPINPNVLRRAVLALRNGTKEQRAYVVAIERWAAGLTRD
jgi:hypothetical protein